MAKTFSELIKDPKVQSLIKKFKELGIQKIEDGKVVLKVPTFKPSLAYKIGNKLVNEEV